MGCKPIPGYANMFMSKIDKKIIEIANQIKEGRLISFNRFLDDMFSIWIGITKGLHKVFDAINKLHPNIKFTMNHTTPKSELKEEQCDCELKSSIPFLDTSVSIENGEIVVDLYKKPTDKNQYLLPSSCHPLETTKAIPFSLALRITRTCTNPETKKQRFLEL